ncbi:hypothetical protein B9T26_07410 [Acinetobacter sp. ANC 4169]|uniref:DUF2750 domain-containing protein n=1 Tax=Acinetobacter sp. ANC 4169 TaxID=1977879 RepID=UPI000A357C89|nr:DUF2750 domain-containing protein [Acinetobacter sp. ANC 4169]OTG73966.1 hypothetical protein B9T26_07410 [Acinetobacter sp. ANC 4169]
MRNPYQRKAAKAPNNTYNAQEIYKQFVETIVGQGYVHALYDDGWALCATPTGQRAFAIWQTKGLAKLLVKDNWANYQIQEISLKDFVEKVIPFLRQENTSVSMDLTPEGQNVLVAPEKLLVDIKNYLYQIYVQKPELFKDAKLPLPRNIRLN